MELEKNPLQKSKKFWKTLRIMVYMMKKNAITKGKLLLDIQTLLKRGKSALTESNYYSTLICRSNDAHLSFISPREYEFSCSNTPAQNTSKRKNYYRQPEEQVAVKKLLDMLNQNNVNIESSPYLPGFGRSPCLSVRQLRVTDSPFGANEGEMGSCQVDMDCEEFINKFYKSLKREKRIAALESPSPYRLWAR